MILTKNLLRFIIITFALLLFVGCTPSENFAISCELQVESGYLYVNNITETVQNEDIFITPNVVEPESEIDENFDFWEGRRGLYSTFYDYIGIMLASQESLKGFDYIHEIQMDGWDDDLVIWAISKPLVGFEVMKLRYTYDEDWNPHLVLGEVLVSFEALQPKQAFVIRSHSWWGYVFIDSLSVSFLDTYGQRRYLEIADSPFASGEPFWFNELFLGVDFTIMMDN